MEILMPTSLLPVTHDPFMIDESAGNRNFAAIRRTIVGREKSWSSVLFFDKEDSGIHIGVLSRNLVTQFLTVMSGRANRTIYVGNLPLDIRESEVEDLFYKYGRIMEIELKNPPRPPGYCFVEFESSRDADDAIRGRDGYNFDGHRLRVELAHGGRGHSSSFGRGSSYGSGGGSKYGASHRSEYRVIVRGLPSAASWQDLKDHMRKAGDVCFAQVFRDRDGTTGLVDYTNYEDMKYAIRKLDDTEFKNPFSRSYIRVKMYEGSPGNRSRSRSYSRSRSPIRNRSKSLDRSASPRSRSASLARSRSRSR